jgi:hypothetical protein
MPSRVETIMEALRGLFAATTGAEVVRNEGQEVRVPGGGLIVLRDGEPGDPEVSMCPLTYHYERLAMAEVIAPPGDDTDAITVAMGAAILSDRTLGGLVDWTEAQAAETGDIDTDGGTTLRVAMVPIRLHYATHDPLA